MATSEVPADPAGLTEDAFLGGRITLRQPRRGHRSGLEAVLIAAACPVQAGETVLDLGAGVGAAGLCALARVEGSRAVLVEADAGLCDLASANAAANGLAPRVRVLCCDVVNPAPNARAAAAQADHAVCNPPFYDAGSARISAARAAAHALSRPDLDAWFRFAAGCLKPGGTLTLVHRAEALGRVLAGLDRRFGDIRLLPIHPRPGRAATRILLLARKGSRAPATLLPGLVLHPEDGHGFTPHLEAVLREAAPLALAEPAD